MTTGTDQGSTTASSKTQEMASAAQHQGSAVADTAMNAGRDVAREAATQVSAVGSEAKNQLDTVVHQAKDEIRSQVDTRGRQAADGLMTISRQLSALAEGRREEAGRVGEIVTDAQQRLQTYAERLQERGPQALVDDVTTFARRRPGVFLMGAVATGFMVGRLVRAGAAANKEQQSGNGRSGNGWDASWQVPAAQGATVPSGTRSGMAGTGISGSRGPAQQSWPATGPSGTSTESTFGMETP